MQQKSASELAPWRNVTLDSRVGADLPPKQDASCETRLAGSVVFDMRRVALGGFAGVGIDPVGNAEFVLGFAQRVA